MSRQMSLFQPEDFVRTQKDLPAMELVKCYGCQHIVPARETLGGFCKDCLDPEKEEASEKTGYLDKGPRFPERGGELSQ